MLPVVSIVSLLLFAFFFPPFGHVVPIVVYFFMGLMTLHITGAIRALLTNWRTLNKFSRTALIIQVALWAFVGVLHHPGFVNQDTFGMQVVFLRGDVSTWFTIIYSLMVRLFFFADPSLFTYGLFHVFIFICCLYKCFKIAQPKSWLVVAVITLLTAHPLLQASTFFLTRDILFSLMTVYLVLCFGERWFNKVPMDFHFLAHTFLIVFLLSGMRQEAILYVVGFPLLVFFLGVEIKFKNKVAVCLMLAGAVAAWNLSFNSKNMNQTGQAYQLTGVIHPLNYIVYNHHANINSSQKSAIAKVVDFEYLSVSYLPYSISPFHNRKFTLPVPQEDWKQFLDSYCELVLQFPMDFLEERMSVFLRTMSLTEIAFVYPDEFDRPTNVANLIKSTFGIERWIPVPELTALHNKYLHSMYLFRSESIFVNFLSLGSPLLLLLLSVVAMAFCGSNLMIFFYFISSAFCFVRIPAVFLLAPEPQMKYYAILIYYPVFMIILGLLLFKDRKDASTLCL